MHVLNKKYNESEIQKQPETDPTVIVAAVEDERQHANGSVNNATIAVLNPHAITGQHLSIVGFSKQLEDDST